MYENNLSPGILPFARVLDVKNGEFMPDSSITTLYMILLVISTLWSSMFVGASCYVGKNLKGRNGAWEMKPTFLRQNWHPRGGTEANLQAVHCVSCIVASDCLLSRSMVLRDEVAAINHCSQRSAVCCYLDHNNALSALYNRNGQSARMPRHF